MDDDPAHPPAHGPDPDQLFMDASEDELLTTLHYYTDIYWAPAKSALEKIDFDNDSFDIILRKINESIEEGGADISKMSDQMKVAVFYGLWTRIPNIDPEKRKKLEERQEQIFRDAGLENRVTINRIYDRVQNKDQNLHSTTRPDGPDPLASEMKLLRTIDRIAHLI